jgi:hypothetical protein
MEDAGLVRGEHFAELWCSVPATISWLVRAVEATQLQTLADDFMVDNPNIRIDLMRAHLKQIFTE